LKRNFLNGLNIFRDFIHRLFHFDRLECSVEINPQNYPVYILFLLLLIYYVISPTQVGMILLAGMFGILFSAYFWARQMATRITVYRRLHYMAFQVGDELEELVSVYNRSLLPVLWCEFVDGSNIPGYSLSGIRSVGGNDKIEFRVSALCAQRGVFHLGPLILFMGDPFGFFRILFTFPHHEEILVYPPLAPLPPQILAHRFTFGDQRSLRQAVAAETINAFTTREYQSGDPLRHIHWPTTARRNSPYVRMFDPESSSSIWLVPDFNADNHLGKGEESSVEKMVILVASLADNFLKQKLTVGLAAESDGLKISPARQGRASLWPLLKVLSPIQPSGNSSVQNVLGRLRTLVSNRDLILVVTASLDPGWINQLKYSAGASLVNRLQFIILNPVSFGANLPDDAFQTWMAFTGISAVLVQKEDIKPYQDLLEKSNRWDFKVLGTGRVVAQHAPRVADGFREGSQ
jgi:uncharacterized protein (DUF58 family)